MERGIKGVRLTNDNWFDTRGMVCYQYAMPRLALLGILDIVKSKSIKRKVK
jgi:hypothetical protein